MKTKKRLTPNQKLKNELLEKEETTKRLKVEKEVLQETLAMKRVNESLSDADRVIKFFRNLPTIKDYKREEIINSTMAILEEALRNNVNGISVISESDRFYEFNGERVATGKPEQKLIFTVAL